MGIVNELQSSCERDDVLTVILKAKRVSSKLNRQDISAWLHHEQNGYPNGSDVPDYRRVPVSFAYATNGPVPVGYGLAADGIQNLGDLGLGVKLPVGESIGEVLNWINSPEQSGIFQQVHADIVPLIRQAFRTTRPDIVARFTWLTQLNKSSLSDIPNQVKNKILDWALELERANIHGEDHSFTKEEKRQAERVVFNDYSTTITGDVTGAVQAGSPHATQNVTITQTEVGRTIQRFEEAVDQSSEVDDVDKADIKATLNLIRQLAAKDLTPKTKMKLHEKMAALWSAVQIYENLAPMVKPYWIALKATLGIP
jgi:hypothetical protein